MAINLEGGRGGKGLMSWPMVKEPFCGFPKAEQTFYASRQLYPVLNFIYKTLIQSIYFYFDWISMYTSVNQIAWIGDLHVRIE